MTEKEVKDKAEEEKLPKPKKPLGWREFQKVLKVVVKAPPMKVKRSTQLVNLSGQDS